MKYRKLIAFAIGVFALAALPVHAQDSGPLIDLLIKKGIVTDQEAETLRAELVKDFVANTGAGKLNLAATDSEFRISGDARVRWEDRTGTLASGDHSERGRFRYRLRTSITGRVVNDWAYGLRLETATGNRSSNVTMGDDAGPFAKTSDALNVGQIYLSYMPSPAFTFTAGRMPNPFVTSSMVWDGDINPEGLAETFRHRTGQNELFATFGQFLYSAASTQNAFGAAPNVKDLLMLGFQGGYKLYTNEINANEFFMIAPALYSYARTDQVNNPAAFKGVFTAANTTAINNLAVLDIPAEYNAVLGGVMTRAFGEYAINIDGKTRATKWGRPDLASGESRQAYTLGFQYGKAANKGEWDAKVAWQSVGAFALDPNLVDSDLFDSRTNMKGWYLSGNYALGAATMLTFTYGNAERLDSTLVAPGAGDVGTSNALDDFKVFQFDLNLKF